MNGEQPEERVVILTSSLQFAGAQESGRTTRVVALLCAPAVFSGDAPVGFRILGLSPEPFRHLYGLSDSDLRERGAVRCLADRPAAFPDRIELRDAAPGEPVILVNYVHQPAGNPFRASHAIFVLEGAERRFDRIDEVPDVMRIRTLSLRAFDADDLMIDADLCDGGEIETLIDRFLSDSRVAYIHAHYARRGCYAARIERGGDQVKAPDTGHWALGSGTGR